MTGTAIVVRYDYWLPFCAALWNGFCDYLAATREGT